MVYHTQRDPIICPHSGCKRTRAFSRVDALQHHIVCVALEINGIHPTYNVAPRKGVIKTFTLPLAGAGAVLKRLVLAPGLSYVQTVADPSPNAIR
jgi:hypothetical protein